MGWCSGTDGLLSKSNARLPMSGNRGHASGSAIFLSESARFEQPDVGGFNIALTLRHARRFASGGLSGLVRSSRGETVPPQPRGERPQENRDRRDRETERDRALGEDSRDPVGPG